MLDSTCSNSDNVRENDCLENVQVGRNYNSAAHIEITGSRCSNKRSQDENQEVGIEAEYIGTQGLSGNFKLRTRKKRRLVDRNEWYERSNKIKRMSGKEYFGKKNFPLNGIILSRKAQGILREDAIIVMGNV